MKKFLSTFSCFASVGFLFLALLFSSTAALLHAKPIRIAITSNDVEALGGWTLDRKWYALAIQNLSQSGAKRIFIDLAFPFADAAHPESDDFFYETLLRTPNLYLLYSGDDLSQNQSPDSINLLGNRKFPSARVFRPFSSAFQLSSGAMLFNPTVQPTLTSLLNATEHHASEGLLRFDLPEKNSNADYAFQTAVRGSVTSSGEDVVIYLDYPGVTSYIADAGSSQSFSTTELQLWASEAYAETRYKKTFPLGTLAALMLICFAPLFFLTRFSKKYHAFLFSLGLLGLVFTGLFIMQVYIAPLWFLLFTIPIGGLIYVRLAATQTPAAPVVAASVPAAAPVSNAETEALRYKLKYYENLSNQIPDMPIESESILYAKNSPVASALTKAREVAKTDLPVLIFGESGTGKEKLAEFIHAESSRAEKPFVAVNCGAFNDNLIESELFGYEAGAFTGATKQKQGRFEQANGGTLFLDELGEISPAFQVKLLRVLQEGIFERVGGTKPVKVNVRVVGATHQNLTKLIDEKKFREDLFYRLNGFSLTLLPLRERTMDIEHLFRKFLYAQNPDLKFSDELLLWLKSQAWRGNIRELKSATERASLNAALRKRNFLLPEDFELAAATTVPSAKTDDALPDKVLDALRRHEFKHRAISAVATDLAIHRVTVTEYLRGWVIHFLVQHNGNAGQVYQSLRGSAVIQNEAQFTERIDDYILGIYTKLREGITDGENFSKIKSSRFKGIPSRFETDLETLFKQTTTKQN
jgi:DNA-binding NtrC family response regulator